MTGRFIFPKNWREHPYEKSPFLDSEYPFHATILHLNASTDAKLAWIKQALADGHDVNRVYSHPEPHHKFGYRGRPLHEAIEWPPYCNPCIGDPSNLVLVRFLLDNGADPRLKDRYGKATPMDRARWWLNVKSVDSDFLREALEMMEKKARILDGRYIRLDRSRPASSHGG
ncbi:hypothetical protein PG985_003810 [Apiospora marii]|uniref:uncharacterized protein n=1 Tax=Apiospora marii TaxID=335849 RepID=UPI003130B307